MALKKLTHSDLTFFKCYYSNQGEKPSKQKALNLNSDVFVDELYPDLRRSTADTKLPVTLQIFGPGLEGVHTLQRKILKSKGSKNWRLNGELIYSPEDNLKRYDSLRPGDIALIGFEGNICPTITFIDFLSVSVDDDNEIYTALDGILTAPMQTITSSQLMEVISQINPPANHPIYRFLLTEDLIEAVEGDAEAILRVYKRSGAAMSSEELAASKQKAAYIGSKGEELVSQYFQHLLEEGLIISFEWTSRENAVAPYDFKIVNTDNSVNLLDVKSTAGKFENKFHISRAELLTMSNDSEQYDLYRVYELTENSGKLKITLNMHSFAKQLLEELDHLPAGVTVDSISCTPELLNFSDSIELSLESGE